MARAWSPDVIAAMKAGVIELRWLLSMHPDEGALRCTDNGYELTFEGQTYEAARGQWRIEGTIQTGALLVPETVTVSFDGADQYTDTSLIGRLLDRTWHRRDVVLSGLLLDLDTRAILDSFDQWRGRMDQISTSSSEDAPATVTISCESGAFNALATNHSTVSDADQRRRNPGDDFLKNQALKVGQKMPFGISNSNIPGYRGGTR